MVERTRKQKSFTYLVFIRHGERADMNFSDEQNKDFDNTIEHDPSLTSTGQVQATQAGEYFRQRLAEVQQEFGIVFDEIRVESSPFLRCLQTASKIAKSLKQENINVEYRVSEVLLGFDEVEGDLFDGLNLKVKGNSAEF